MQKKLTAAELAVFCKQKGFIYPSSEVYGGLAGLYDYGHLGTKLKKNFESIWRSFFLGLNANFFEIETATIMPEKVFKASGHLEHFIDPVAKCSKCDFSERADHLLEKILGKKLEGVPPEELTKLIQKNKVTCPLCKHELLPVSVVNMMFPVSIGIGVVSPAYLRPETAQSPYVNFKLQYELLRKKLPLGLALVGRAYRNEISPRNLTLRMREFTQAELQIFFNPHTVNEHPNFDAIKNYPLRAVLIEDRKKKDIQERTAAELAKTFPKFYVYHLAKIQQFYLDVLGINRELFRLYELNENERAFYNKYHFDIEIKLSEYGFTEMGGVHYRTDHDLSGHEKISGQNMGIFDEESGQKFIPHVLELSFGVDRNVYALLDLNYDDNSERGNIILHFPVRLAPFLSAVFPLVKNKPEIVAKSKQVYQQLQSCYSCFYDEASSVGRRYARADEIGVPYCITIDFDSLEDNSVTIRNRDTTKQERIKITELNNKLFELYTQQYQL